MAFPWCTQTCRARYARALSFRVGTWDEPLPLRGITHLVEHLALHRFDALAHHKNGHVQGSSTEFIVSGNEAQVVDFLNGVCAALRELPLSRLETEKKILLTEAQTASPTSQEVLLHARFGAGGPSRITHDESAVRWVGESDVVDWAHRWFVAENAVLWISRDELPAGLDLRLPSGGRMPNPGVEPLPRSRPLSLQGPPRVVMADALVPRSTAASMTAELMRVVLFRELRLELGISYTAHASYESMDADTARLFVVTDASDEHEGAVLGATIDALAALRAGRVDQRDVDAARGAYRELVEQWNEPGLIARVAAGRLLFDEPIVTPESLLAEADAVTTEQMLEVVRAFWDDAIWSSPVGSLDWIGAHDLSYSSAPVEGRWYEYIGTRDRLVVGDSGVSWVSPERSLTVRFDDCEMIAAAADGGRQLIGSDAVTLTIEPTLIRGFGQAELADLDGRVPADRVVPFPARSDENIPQPPQVEKPRRRRGLGLWALFVGAAIFIVLGLPTLGIALDYAGRIGEIDSDGELIDVPLVVSISLFPVVFIGLSAWLIVAAIRRMRDRASSRESPSP